MARSEDARSNKRVLSWCVFLIFSLLLCFPAQTAAGGKPEVINLAPVLDVSGPYAPITGPLAPGLKDACQYINNELNGVHGVKVNLVIRDFAGKVNLALSMYNEAINMKPKPLFTIAGSSTLAAALRERYKDDDIVGFSPTSVDAIYPASNSFGIYPLYAEMTAVALKYVKENWKEKRRLKMAIITWDTGYGKAILYDGFYNYCKEIGFDIVGTELFGIRETDATSQLLRLRAKNPDILVTNTTAHGPIVIKKALKTMGWKIPVINNAGNDWGVIGMAPPLFYGDIFVMPTKSWDETDDTSIVTLNKYFKLNKRTKKDRSVFYLFGWTVALTWHKAMVDTVDKYGWEGLTPANLKEVLFAIKDFKPLNGLTEVTYSEKRPTLRKARLYKISNKGLFLPITDFIEVPDLRPEKYR